MRRLIIILFYIPVVFSTLNAQAFLAKFTPASFSQVQVFAYFNVCAVIFGAFLLLKKKGEFARPIKLWITFYIVYYALALLGNVVMDSSPHRLLPSLVPVSYFIGFAVLLSIPEQRRPLANILTFAFFGSAILLIVFNYFNIHIDYDGVYQYKLDRAGGVYGDANNSAVSALMSFLFINYFFEPKTRAQKIFKTVAIIISIYAVFITFSKTGLLVLLIVLLLAYRKSLTFSKVVFGLLLVPPTLYVAYSWLVGRGTINLKQQERIESIFNLLTLQTDKVDYSYRDVLLKNMFNYIEQSPFIGHGVQFSNSIRGHNTVIGIWADTGIIGFLVFLFAMAYFIFLAFNKKKEVRLFSLSALFVLCVFMLSLQTIINQSYLMVVLAFIGYLIDTKTNKDGVLP